MVDCLDVSLRCFLLVGLGFVFSHFKKNAATAIVVKYLGNC